MTINFNITIKAHNATKNNIEQLLSTVTNDYPFFKNLKTLKHCSEQCETKLAWYKKHWLITPDTKMCKSDTSLLMTTTNRIPFLVLEALSRELDFGLDISIKDDYDHSQMIWKNFNREEQIFNEIMY